MAFIVTFSHQDQEIGFVTHEQDLKCALLRGFHLLIQELGDDSDRINDAQDEICNLSVSELENYTFTTDARAYRSEIRYRKHVEVPYEEFASIYKHAEHLGVYCN